MKVIPLIVTFTVIAMFSMIAVGAAPATEKQVVVPQTHLGLTAKQWHARAVLRTTQRNEVRATLRKAKAATMLLREAFKRTLNADLYGSHWLERAFQCIHGFEGSWTDPNAPYYGGLQMDMSFQRSYGSEYLAKFGTADNWPVSVQMAVAIKAYLSGRGFYPWPNTARYCGLIG